MQLNEWNLKPDPVTLAYHLGQMEEPYRSTVHFADFIEEKMQVSKNVMDLGCGAGAPTQYIARKYPNTQFVGLDASIDLISHAAPAPNIAYVPGDLMNLPVLHGVDGVTLIQVLSWVESYHVPLHQIATRLRPKWIAFSTLVYDGDIDCKIVVTEHKRPRTSYYNIYGMDGIKRAMLEDSYQLVKHQPFFIDIDLHPPNNKDLMGTHTHEGMQFSGPLHLPWYFVMFERAR